MKPILLVGVPEGNGFAAHRTRHFAEAIGHAVGGHRLRVLDFGEDIAGAVSRLDPAAVVTASNYGPTKSVIAGLAGHEHVPLWLDVAGDPFAEAQAYAAAHPAVPAAVIAEDARRVWADAYARADAFSVVCEPGRFALLGALGAFGRLPLLALGTEPVWTVPVAMAFGDRPGEPRSGGFRVVLVGGFNTWFDDETLLAGLLRAMDKEPVEVVVCGGTIAGHYDAGFNRFRAGAVQSRHAARFSFRGWVPAEQLTAIVDACDLTVVLDRPGPEAELGSRTRLLYAVHRGLRVLATTRSPLARELVARGLVEPVAAAVEVGADQAVERLSGQIVDQRSAPPRSLQAAAQLDYSVMATTTPLRAWVTAPRVSVRGPRDGLAASLAREADDLRSELAALRASPTYRVLDGIKRRIVS